MVAPISIILLCLMYQIFGAQHHHTIPVEGYETELQFLGQHVEIPETPVKVIKITKTVAVKIPVPYPVKVKEKVPYPVHVAKPYPVPVPQIIHVPHVASPGHHDDQALNNDEHQYENLEHINGHDSIQYQVQDGGQSRGGHSFPDISGQGHSFESNDKHQDYSAPNFYSHSGNGGDGPQDSKNYDDAIKHYLDKHQSGGDSRSSGYNYH